MFTLHLIHVVLRAEMLLQVMSILLLLNQLCLKFKYRLLFQEVMLILLEVTFLLLECIFLLSEHMFLLTECLMDISCNDLWTLLWDTVWTWFFTLWRRASITYLLS